MATPTKRTPAIIPDRRRTRFPLNGGPRPAERHKRAAARGIEQARQAVAASQLELPLDVGGPGPLRPLAPEQVARARRGLANARRILEGEQDSSRPAFRDAA